MLKFRDCGFKKEHSFKEYESVIVKVGDYHHFFTLNNYKNVVIMIDGNGSFQGISKYNDHDSSDIIATWETFLEDWYDETEDFEIVQYFDNNFLLDITIASKIEK